MNQIVWPRDQRVRAEKAKVGLFAIGLITKNGYHVEFAGPSSEKIDAIIKKALDDVIAADAEETKRKKEQHGSKEETRSGTRKRSHRR